jgi:hypothetical protein
MILDESHYFQYCDISTRKTTMNELNANRSRTNDIEQHQQLREKKKNDHLSEKNDKTNSRN